MDSERFAEIRDDRLKSTFFRSITIVTSAAAITLAGSEGRFFPSGLTPLFALCSWILVDHLQWLRLPVFAGNLCGICALFAAGNEFWGGTLETKLLSGAHLLVYLTWIVLLLPKRHRQYWWLIALSVLQIAVSGLLSSGVGFGAAIVGMLLLMLWTMSVFSLYRVLNQYTGREKQSAIVVGKSEWPGAAKTETTGLRRRRPGLKVFLRSFLGLPAQPSRNGHGRSGRPGMQIAVRNGLQRDPSETWVGPRFRWMVAGSYVISLILSMIVFAAFPRVWMPGTSLFADSQEPGSGVGGNRTGFSDSVELGEIGTLLENNDRVLSFEVTDLKTKQEITAEAFAEAMGMDEVRFRGGTFAIYRDGKWQRGFSEHGLPPEFQHRVGEQVFSGGEFRVEITQDPTSVFFAFAPYPVTREVLQNDSPRLMQLEVSQSLVWPRRSRRGLSRTFVVDCCRPENLKMIRPDAEFNVAGAAIDEDYRGSNSRFLRLFYVMNGNRYSQPAGLGLSRILSRPTYNPQFDLKITLPTLYQEANRICRQDNQRVSPKDCVDRILNYLSIENGFAYSLRQSRQNRGLDPLEDFLINTKKGHCEYFATACALMLQSVQVPARLVNGYYGCEINSLTGKYEVRQRHAHAWVEAWIDDRWVTVEPTPSSSRPETGASGSSTSLISNLQTALSDFWNDGIQRMSADRQKEFFAPVLDTSRSLMDTIREQGLLTALRDWVSRFLRSPKDWISWKSGVGTFVFLLFLAGLVRAATGKKFRDLWNMLRDALSRRQRTARSVIRFYERFCSLCERHGLRIPPSNSALENARLACDRFQIPLQAARLRDLPFEVARAFNEVRFGSLSLTEEQTARIGRELSVFADALRAPASAAEQKIGAP